MNVSLTRELEKFVEDKVRSGRYQTASEVVRDALRLLEEREQVRQLRLKDLRKEIRKGLQDTTRIPSDEVFAVLQKRQLEFEGRQ